MEPLVINVFDKDPGRRADITSTLTKLGIRAEPYAGLSELEGYWPAAGILVVYDDGHNVTDIMSAMYKFGKWLPIVACSERPSLEAIVSAVWNGALDYLSWPMEGDQLIEKLTSANARGASLFEEELKLAEARYKLNLLSPRESQVLEKICLGFSNKEIADHLSISPRTVEIHRANMLKKLESKRTMHAVRMALLCKSGDRLQRIRV